MEKKELRKQYYKLVERTIEITMDGFENLSYFWKADCELYLCKIEDLIVSLTCMDLIESQMYHYLFVLLEQAKRKINDSMEEYEWYAILSSLCIWLFITCISIGNSHYTFNSWSTRVEQKWVMSWYNGSL